MSEYRSRAEHEASAKLIAAQAQATEAEIAAKREKARADAAAAAIELKNNKAAADTKRLREQLAQAKVQQQLAEQAEQAKDAKATAKARRRDESADDGSVFKRLVLAFVIICMAAALPAQISYFAGLHKTGDASGGVAWLMTPLPLVMELAAWVGVAGTAWAGRKGLSKVPFWLLTAGLSGFAGWINYTHGVEQYGLVAGMALAASSFAGPLMWELREALDSQAAVESRSREQRAADKAKAAKEKAAAAAKAAHNTKRAKQFPNVWARYEQILAAHPLGTLDEDAAWAQAWTDIHRAPLSVTAATYAGRVSAQRALESVLGEERAVHRELDAFLGELLGAGGDDDGEGDKSPVATSPTGPGGTSSEARKPQGGEGKRVLLSGRRPRVEKPLSNEHLEQVRQYADLLAESKRVISTRMVADLIGGGEKNYISRLTRAVKNERGE